MSYYAVTREAGTAWADGGIAVQSATNDHAGFINTLADEQFVLLAGPLAGTEQGRLRLLLIVSAGSEAESRGRLAADPWAISGQLEITRIEPWDVFVGVERLGLAQPASVEAA
jgi:uncharacterized protein YciI